MPLMPGKANMGSNIKTEMDAGKPQKQAVAIAENVAHKKGGMGEDHKAAIAKMHPEHLHKMVMAAHSGEYGPKAQQMAQQAMQGQSSAPGMAPAQDGEQQDTGATGGRDYASMFGGGGGMQDEKPAAAPNRASMFDRSGGM